MKRRNILLIILASLLIPQSSCTPSDKPDNLTSVPLTRENIFEIDGLKRIYLLHLPQNLPNNAPLVFVIHGFGDNATAMMKSTSMNSIADKNGFAVCYPQGNKGKDGKNSWNAGYSNLDIDDDKFLSALAGHLQKEFNLSTQNTFCTGMSNGADMCYQLACRKPDLFSAAAPVAGCMMQPLYDSCNSTDGVPIFEIHGDKDTITLWAGDPDYPHGGYVSVRQTIDLWIKKNNCTNSSIDKLPDINTEDGSFVITEKHKADTNNHQVWLYTVVGGKHDWPGAYGNMDLNASEEIWNFFKLFVK